MDNLDLSNLLRQTNADGALIANLKGELIKSENIKHSNNIAAMLGVISTMVTDFSSDVGMGDFKQVLFKAEKGVFVADIIENFIVAVHSKDKSRAGLIMMSMDKLLINSKSI